MSRPRIVLGNWKMNTSLGEATAIAERLRQESIDSTVTVGVAPPFPWLRSVIDRLGSSSILVGAQTCASTENGAYTGEVSASMLSDLCRFVLVGHSERRTLFGETDAIVREKALRVIESRLIPVVCVGETLAQRKSGDADQVVRAQINGAFEQISNANLANLVVAYEPVWAIGTGMTASPEDASAMVQTISAALANRGIFDVPVLYGGSVTANNAGSLIAQPGIDGFLVGGASLNPDDFLAIVREARN